MVWYPSAKEVPTRGARTIAAPKIMLKAFLGIHGAIFIDWFPPEERFNSEYFCEKIRRNLSQVLDSGCDQVP
jgi:hypothetical protein